MKCSRGRRVGRGGGPVDAGLVGEDYELNAIAEPQLHQDPLDVGPDRGLLDDELSGTSRFASPRATNSRTSCSRGVSSWSLA
jgi:hypothetical protein